MSVENLICDKCRKNISTPEEGYIEWVRNNTTNDLTRFHIVHNKHACLYNEKEMLEKLNARVPGNHLKYFLGIDGLIKLLNLIDNDNVVNKFEVVEIIKRTQVLGYEEAQNFFKEAYSRGMIDGPNDNGFYFPPISHIDEINKRFGSKE